MIIDKVISNNVYICLNEYNITWINVIIIIVNVFTEDDEDDCQDDTDSMSETNKSMVFCE